MGSLLGFDSQPETLVTDRSCLIYDAGLIGYDQSFWKTFSGSPSSVAGSGIQFRSSRAFSLRHGMFGTYIFRLAVTDAPAAGHSKAWGMSSTAADQTIGFVINGSSFTAVVANGAASTSISITWDANWTNTFVDYKIVWEFGFVEFYANSTLLGRVKNGDGSIIVPFDKPLIPIIRESNGDGFVLNSFIMQGVRHLTNLGGATGSVTVTSSKNPSSFQNLNSGNSGVVKAGAGRLYSISCHNISAVNTWYLQLFDKAIAAVVGDVPTKGTWIVPPGQTLFVEESFFTDKGCPFSNGITWGVSTSEFTFQILVLTEHVINGMFE